MKKLILSLLLISPIIIWAQEEPKTESGRFSLGVRSSLSLFNDGNAGIGQGAGGQFRIQVNKKVNTEWFADYLTSGIGNYANRKDGHIGWSVMFYMSNSPNKKNSLSPYLLAGHCFDYTKMTDNFNSKNTLSRWSSAVQMGFGSHYNFTERFDVSLNTQYMIHLGKEITANSYPSLIPEQYSPTIVISSSAAEIDLEGHLLVTMSMNYRLADFNKKK